MLAGDIEAGEVPHIAVAGWGPGCPLVKGCDQGLSLFRCRHSSSSSSQQSQNIRRAKKVVQDNQYDKAIKALTSDFLAIPSAEVLQKLLAEHHSLLLQPCPLSSIAESAIDRVARTFPIGSAPRSSGLRPSNLWEAVACPPLTRQIRCLLLSPIR